MICIEVIEYTDDKQVDLKNIISLNRESLKSYHNNSDSDLQINNDDDYQEFFLI